MKSIFAVMGLGFAAVAGAADVVKLDWFEFKSTEVAGGFVGTVLGPFARQE